MKIFKKIIFGLIGVAIILHLGILGVQAFITWQGNQNNSQDQTEKERKAKKEEMEIEKLKRELEGYQGKCTPWEWDDTKGYLGVKGIGEIPKINKGGRPGDNHGEGVLIFSNEIKTHLAQILKDIDDWLNNTNNSLEPLPGLSESHNYPYLIRNNCILYGAPGTGKTEFVRELSRILIERYGKTLALPLTSDDPNDPNYGITLSPQERELAEKGIKKARIPVFELKGVDLMSTGKDEPRTYDKLIACVKKAKSEFFKESDPWGNVGENSQLPYIVFVDEADQAKNPLTYNPQAKNNLEEFKNFFSTGSEGKGLASGAQDRNSIFIMATNNYETIDPAMKRWGRLGVSLNFTWGPETIRQYGEQQDRDGLNYHINWLKIGLRDHYCWKFADNDDRELLFKLAKKINFHNYEKSFVPKTNQILRLWEEWDEEQRDDFAKSKLGLENKVWCATCQKETSPETIGQKEKRIKEALKRAGDDPERKSEIYHQEMEKKLTDCKYGEHQAKPIANWLLHYVHTFYQYHERQDLENFKKPDQIQRYPYNEQRLLRERINQLRIDLTEINQDIANNLGSELRKVSNNLEQIKNFNTEVAIKELENVRQAIDSLTEEIRASANKIYGKL